MVTLIRPRRRKFCLGLSVFATPLTTIATFGTPIVSIVAAMRWQSAFGQSLEKDKGRIGRHEESELKQRTEHFRLAIEPMICSILR